MPYRIEKVGGMGFKVQNRNSGRTLSKKPMSRAKAKKQMAAVYASEKKVGPPRRSSRISQGAIKPKVASVQTRGNPMESV